MGLIFDSHAHYDDRAFDNDRHDLLSSLPSKGVYRIVNAGCDIASSKVSVELAHKYHYIYAAAGVHPHSALQDGARLEEIRNLLGNDKVIAVGEIGLDYHYNPNTKDAQKSVFQNQIEMAAENNLPIIVHDREAHGDTLSILKNYRIRGVVHCFSGSVEMAREIINMGMYIGLGGAVTFKNAKMPMRVAQEIPIECIVLETDAPYMAPVPYRGKRCDSSYISLTAEKIAEVRGCDKEKILSVSKEHAIRLFNLEERL